MAVGGVETKSSFRSNTLSKNIFNGVWQQIFIANKATTKP